MLAGCVQWGVAFFVSNIEITFFPAYKNFDCVKVIVSESNLERSFALPVLGVYVFTTA